MYSITINWLLVKRATNKRLHMNPAQELIDDIFSETNLHDKLMKIIDLWASFVVPDCFEHGIVQRCDLTAMIDKFIRMVMQPISFTLNSVGVSLYNHTVIPYKAREILSDKCLDLCIDMAGNCESYFDNIISKHCLLRLSEYNRDADLSHDTRCCIIRCFLWNNLLTRSIKFYDTTNKKMVPYVYMIMTRLRRSALDLIPTYTEEDVRNTVVPILNEFIYDISLLLIVL
jgi:hypothetical protein